MCMILSDRRLTVALATAALVVLSLSPATAEVSLKGKTVQMGIGSDPGGGTDRAGRLVGQFLEKYLPGKPTVVIKNFGAGGGKIRAANYLALEAPKDGTFALQGDASPLQPHVLRRKVARYDPTKFRPVGAINRGGSVIFVRKDAHKRLMDAKAKPVIVGAISGTRSWQIMLLMAKEYMGWNLKWVPGYKGTGALTKAIRQGEIDMFATNNVYVINELVKDGVVDLLAQEGQGEGNDYVPRDSFKDVAIFPKLLAKANPPEIAIDAYNAVLKPGEADKWVMLPPGTPDDIVSTYRAAYAKVVKDPDFLKIARKQLSPEIYYITGENVERLVRASADVSDKAIDFGAKLRKKYGLSAR